MDPTPRRAAGMMTVRELDVPERLRSLWARERDGVNSRCRDLLAALRGPHARLSEAIEYALLGDGKRFRPILCLWTHDAAGGARRDAALDVACALECIHAYSLVHDDLPCMDDDDLRRGRPTVHRRFDVATAVLAGDALLTLAFEIVSSLPRRRSSATAEMACEVAAVLSGAGGANGLIAGQAFDLESGPRAGGAGAVERIHRLKTGALIAAAMEAGAVVAGGSIDRDTVRECGVLAGRAFQIADDVLDVVADGETLGKTPGKDAALGKLTYPGVVGLDRARQEASALVDSAAALLPDAPAAADLAALLRFFVDRSA